MSKISELSDGGALQSTDYLIAVRSGGNVKVQLSELPSGIGAGGNIVFGDNEKAIFGAGSDLQIYHDGSNSYIEDAGTGVLFIKGTGGVYLRGKTTDEDLGRFLENGAVDLYYDGSSKLATTATGIDVTGTVTADGLTLQTSENIISWASGNGIIQAPANVYVRSTGTGDLIFQRDTATAAKKSMEIDGATGDISFYEDTGTTPKFFWDASAERLGLGTTSPLGKLAVEGSGTASEVIISRVVDVSGLYSRIGWTAANGLDIGVDSGNVLSASHLTMSVDGSEAMRIDSNGFLNIGVSTAISSSTNTSDGFTFAPSGGYAWLSVSDTGGIYVQRQNDNSVFSFYRGSSNVGSISVTSSATVYNTLSDQRLKDNITDAPSSSDDIDAIQVRSFDWKADGSHQKYGMVAQELQSVAPEAVSGDADSDDMMGVDYSKLVPMLVKEIQSLRARVAQLEGV